MREYSRIYLAISCARGGNEGGLQRGGSVCSSLGNFLVKTNRLHKGRNSEQIRQDDDLRAKGNLSARFL
jgi:hypothetical protein